MTEIRAKIKDLGRRVGGQWAVSKVGLAVARWRHGYLAAYLSGDRRSPTILATLSGAMGLSVALREGRLSEPNILRMWKQ